MAQEAQLRIEIATKEARAALKSLNAELKKTEKGGEGAAEATEDVTSGMSSLKKILVGAGVIAAVVKLTSAFKGLLSVQLQMSEDVNNLANRLGGAVEEISALQQAAFLTGTTFQSFESSALTLNKAIADAAIGMGRAKIVFEQMGIVAEDLLVLPLEEQFVAIADGLSKLTTQAAKAGAAQKLFGTGGLELLDIVGHGTEALKEQVKWVKENATQISGPLAKAQADWFESSRKLELQLQSFANLLLEEVLPVLTKLFEELNKNPEAAKSFAGGLAEGFKALIAFALGVGAATRSIAGLAVALEFFANDEQAGRAAVLEAINEDLSETLDLIKKIYSETEKGGAFVDQFQPGAGGGAGAGSSGQTDAEKIRNKQIEQIETLQGKYNELIAIERELQDEIGLVATEMLQSGEDAVFSMKELEALKAEIFAQAEAATDAINKQTAAVERLRNKYDETGQAFKQYAEDEAKIWELYKNENITLEEVIRLTGKLQEARNELMTSGRDDSSEIKTPDPVEATGFFAEISKEIVTLEEQMDQLGVTFADGMSEALTDFLVTGEADFQKFTTAVLAMITQMIIKMLILKAIEAVGQAYGGGSSSGAGVGAALTAHSGGVVGSPSGSIKSVNPAIFANAPRLHDGLAHDEYPAILQAGETVTPKGQSPGGDVIINMIKGEGVEVEVEERESDQGRQINILANYIENRITSETKRGRGLSPLFQQFGGNRVAGAS